MSTFVGHAIAGALTSASLGGARTLGARLKLATLGGVAALLPDLDIVTFLLLRPAGMVPHRGLSHGIAFAALTCCVLALLARRWIPLAGWRPWLGLFFAASTHPVLDCLMGAGPAVPIFAPISDEGYLLPFRALPTAYYGKEPGAYVTGAYWLPNVLAASLEALIFGPLALLAAKPPTRVRLLAVALASTTLILAYRLYN
jgi:membrane-bound metal-dependent hydrolase YbcI (DUF457 family)